MHMHSLLYEQFDATSTISRYYPIQYWEQMLWLADKAGWSVRTDQQFVQDRHLTTQREAESITCLDDIRQIVQHARQALRTHRIAAVPMHAFMHQCFPNLHPSSVNSSGIVRYVFIEQRRLDLITSDGERLARSVRLAELLSAWESKSSEVCIAVL